MTSDVVGTTWQLLLCTGRFNSLVYKVHRYGQIRFNRYLRNKKFSAQLITVELGRSIDRVGNGAEGTM